MKSEEILRQFEDDLVAGKNPTVKEYEEKYGKIDGETRGLMEVMMGLVLLGEEAALPAGFEERQAKLARDLIARKKAEEMVQHLQAGEAAFKAGNYAQAGEHYRRLYQFVKYIKDEPWVGFCASRLGAIAEAGHQSERALEYYQTAAETYRKLAMKRELAIVLHNLGNLYLIERKDYRQAQRAYQEAIELNEELGNSFVLPHEYLNLGAVENSLGNNELAKKYYQTSYTLFQEHQDINGLGMAEYNLADLLTDEEAAMKTYRSALGHFQQAGNQALVAQTAARLAVGYINQGDHATAQEMLALAQETLKTARPMEKGVGYQAATFPEIPEEARTDPARLLRFLLDKDAAAMLYQKQ